MDESNVERDTLDEVIESVGGPLTSLRNQAKLNLMALVVTIVISVVTGLVCGLLVARDCFKPKLVF